MRLFIAVLLTTMLLLACATPNKQAAASNDKEEKRSYLALGDSYTIGESVAETERWPILLANALTKKGLPFEKPKIIARTGWRTDDLLQAMNSQLSKQKKYDLVSVLIGVNNQFQGKSMMTYEKDLRMLFDQAIDACKTGKKGVFVVSIPDYGATPYGASRADKIGAAIDKWNAVFKKVSDEYGFPWYDITPISRKGNKDPSLVAFDGLHPSGKMYQLWVDSFVAKVSTLLNS